MDKSTCIFRESLLERVKTNFANAEKYLTESSFKELTESVKTAVDNHINVADFRLKIPALQQKVLYQEVMSHLDKTKDTLRQESYDLLEKSVKKAEDYEVDINNVRVEMPALLKKVLYAKVKVLYDEVKDNLKGVQQDLTESSYDKLEVGLTKAKEHGVDVSDVEKKMPELLKKVLYAKVKDELTKFEFGLDKGDWLSISFRTLECAVTKAKEHGVDVNDVEKKMPELFKKLLRVEVDASLAEVEETFSDISYSILESHIKLAEKHQVDVSDVKKKMPELFKKVLRVKIDEHLDFVKKQASTQKPLSDYGHARLRRLKWGIKEAKGHGIYVRDVEIEMHDILRQIDKNK